MQAGRVQNGIESSRGGAQCTQAGEQAGRQVQVQESRQRQTAGSMEECASHPMSICEAGREQVYSRRTTRVGR